MRTRVLLLILLIFIYPITVIKAQTVSKNVRFNEIKMLMIDGDKTNEKTVSVTFLNDSMTVFSKDQSVKNTFLYSEIKNAEYSYSNNPRWKTGLGLGAASILFPPLLFVAIPLGFSKHRRHWLTIKTADNFTVLKLSKSNRKIFLPTFETKTRISVESVGEDK